MWVSCGAGNGGRECSTENVALWHWIMQRMALENAENGIGEWVALAYQRRGGSSNGRRCGFGGKVRIWRWVSFSVQCSRVPVTRKLLPSHLAPTQEEVQCRRLNEEKDVLGRARSNWKPAEVNLQRWAGRLQLPCYSTAWNSCRVCTMYWPTHSFSHRGIKREREREGEVER